MMMQSNFAVVTLSAICLISVILAAPTTYDQRQDGGVNFAAKLENILIVIATPSIKSSGSNGENDGLETYLTLLDSRNRDKSTSLVTESYGSSKVDQDSGSGDEKLGDDENLKEEAGDKTAVAKSRSIWGQIETAMQGNERGRSLKKVLSWGHEQYPIVAAGDVDDREEQSRSSDNNEVGSLPDRRFTLLGSGTEDCGTERHRDSYGICQLFPV